MFIMRIAILLLVGAALMPLTLAKPASDEGGLVGSRSEERGKQPNIMFIYADDLGYYDIGYNNPKVHTPVLDNLAKQGRILTTNYAQNMCVPDIRLVLFTGRVSFTDHTSRQSLMTGRYPWKDRRETYETTSPSCVPTDIPFLPQLLKDVGYKTHMLGKWHLGFCQEQCLPTKRGFDSFFGIYNGYGDFYNHTDCQNYRMYDWNRDLQPDKTVIGEYATELITTEAVEILENHNPDDGPFFMYVSHLAPHVPLQVGERFVKLYPDEPEERRRVYLGMVSAMDEQIGIMVDALKRLNLKDNTLIIFSSDNGGEGVVGPSDNTPYRGFKYSLYEGGSRVVGFVSGEMLTGTENVHEGFFSTNDWLPTLLRIANGNVDELQLDGIDQSNMILHGAKSKRKEFVYMLDLSPFPILGSAAIRDEEFKLIWGYEGFTDGRGREAHFNGDPHWEIVEHPNDSADPVLDIIQPYRIFSTEQVGQLWAQGIAESNFDRNDINSGRAHLFNLIDDPEERHDLAMLPAYADRVLSMKQRILKLTEEYRPPRPEPDREAEALAAMIDGTWSAGFCDDLDLRG